MIDAATGEITPGDPRPEPPPAQERANGRVARRVSHSPDNDVPF
jgi:hypothetical protein